MGWRLKARKRADALSRGLSPGVSLLCKQAFGDGRLGDGRGEPGLAAALRSFSFFWCRTPGAPELGGQLVQTFIDFVDVGVARDAQPMQRLLDRLVHHAFEVAPSAL